MPQDEMRAAALELFTEYFARNYPGATGPRDPGARHKSDTLIHDPYWHAPKIFRAAEDAIRRAASSPVPQPDDQGCLACVTCGQPVGQEGALPPLPEPEIKAFQSDSTMRYHEVGGFSSAQMQAYARAAIAGQEGAQSEGSFESWWKAQGISESHLKFSAWNGWLAALSSRPQSAEPAASPSTQERDAELTAAYAEGRKDEAEELRIIGYTHSYDLEFPFAYASLGPETAERNIPVYVKANTAGDPTGDGMSEPRIDTLWAPLVKGSRRPWINHYFLAYTRKDCKARYLDFFKHPDALDGVTFVKVQVVPMEPKP